LKDELRQVLEGSCKLIPLKLIANECSEVMDNFIPELVDALASRMDPQVVCAVSGLCNSARIDEMLLEMKELELPKSSKSNKPLKLSPYDPVSCPRCKTFMGRAFNYLKTLSKDQIRMELMAGCGYMSSYSDSCRAAVMEDFDSIYAQIEKADSNEFCALIGICNEQTKAVAVYEPEKNDDLACDFCKQLVNYARQWLTDNTTKEDFEKIVEGLCRRCPAKKECIDFYHQYGGEIYQLILDDLDADSFCQRIGVCPGKKSALFSSSVSN
jgi:saposin